MILINKKIKNATATIVDGIKFRSILEARAAKILKDSGIEFQYEPFKIQYIPKFTYDNVNYRAAYYTPDFVGKDFILEIKGYPNDVWRYKKKLVLLQLMKDNSNLKFYEIKNLTQLKLWIKNYQNGTTCKNTDTNEISS